MVRDRCHWARLSCRQLSSSLSKWCGRLPARPAHPRLLRGQDSQGLRGGPVPGGSSGFHARRRGPGDGGGSPCLGRSPLPAPSWEPCGRGQAGGHQRAGRGPGGRRLPRSASPALQMPLMAFLGKTYNTGRGPPRRPALPHPPLPRSAPSVGDAPNAHCLPLPRAQHQPGPAGTKCGLGHTASARIPGSQGPGPGCDGGWGTGRSGQKEAVWGAGGWRHVHPWEPSGVSSGGWGHSWVVPGARRPQTLQTLTPERSLPQARWPTRAPGRCSGY